MRNSNLKIFEFLFSMFLSETFKNIGKGLLFYGYQQLVNCNFWKMIDIDSRFVKEINLYLKIVKYLS